MTTNRPFQTLVNALREKNGLAAKKPTKQQVADDEDETQADEPDDDPDDRPKKSKKRSQPSDEDNDDEERKPKSLSPEIAARIAADVVRAGAQRRGELPVPLEIPPQPRTAPLSASEVRSTAAAIVAVGKARRGEAP